jgi:hypothetical protein
VALRQAATRALIAESIRRCQGERYMHNQLPLAHNAYTAVTSAACAGVHTVNTKSRKVLRGSDEPPARLVSRITGNTLAAC